MKDIDKISEEIFKVKTPAYVIDEGNLIENLKILKDISSRSGAKILLAQKAFSTYYFYDIIGDYLDGATASGLYEAKLAHQEMKKENHIFSVAYQEEEFTEVLKICDHIIFNSFSQWKKFKERALEYREGSGGRKISPSFGLRINPEISTQDHAIYDPCSSGSRLGITLKNFKENVKELKDLEGIEGFHFHTLCQQNVDALIITLREVENNFSDYFTNLKWINFGGGHHITRHDYDRELLVKTIIDFKEKYGLEVYLEPGEAIALNAGYLITSVLDLVNNDIEIAILDTSATCHMPDVIEMPYRPPLYKGYYPGQEEYTYRLGGPSCLAGDIIGDYSFKEALKQGDKLAFMDMAIYTMVKTNTFNGIPLPHIYTLTRDKKIKLIKSFSYKSFKERLS